MLNVKLFKNNSALEMNRSAGNKKSFDPKIESNVWINERNMERASNFYYVKYMLVHPSKHPDGRRKIWKSIELSLIGVSAETVA